MRTGIIARKEGMSRYFDSEGRHVPVTLLKIDNLQVVGLRSVEQNGYVAVQLGCGTPKVKNLSKAQKENFAKAKVAPKSKVAEFRVESTDSFDIGAELVASHFVAGQFVDVQGVTGGKGFAGVMKRWNFGGGRASHGNSVSHRSPGSTGQRQDPGRVWKNKKMPGHMGVETVTTQNLRVVAIDEAENLILVEGSVPGYKGNWVYITDAVKKALPKEAPKPAGLKKAAQAPAKEEQQQEAAAEAPAQTEELVSNSDQTNVEAKSE